MMEMTVSPRGTVLRVVEIAAICAAALLFLASPPARADHVECGDAITQDTVLDEDILNCDFAPGYGLTVPGAAGADGVTLDLGGFTLDGPGPAQTRIGILVNADNVTIKNGTVREFTDGIAVEGSGGQVKFTALRANTTGLLLNGGGATAKGNYVTGWGSAGIRVTGLNAKVTDNGLRSGAGPGIDAVGVTGANITANDLGRATGAGGDGIRVFGTDTSTVAANEVCGVSAHGIHLLQGSEANTIQDNTLCDNNGSGIFVEHAITMGNLIDSNKVSLTDGSGIVVVDAQKTKVFNNRSRLNEGHGISTNTPGPNPVRLKNNVVNYNQGYGINALQLFTDLGGNTGKGNRDGTCNFGC